MTTAVRRSRGTSAGLTTTLVVDAALAVAHRLGFAKTSLRAVAAELGVSPMAIYNHVAGMEDLLDRVADRFLQQVLDDTPSSEDPVEAVRHLARALFRAALRHPQLLTSVVGHVPDRVPSAQMDYADTMLGHLRRAGASPGRAGDTYRLVVALCLSAAVSSHNADTERQSSLEDRLRLHAEHYAGQPLADYLEELRDRTPALERQLDLLLRDLDMTVGRVV